MKLILTFNYLFQGRDLVSKISRFDFTVKGEQNRNKREEESLLFLNESAGILMYRPTIYNEYEYSSYFPMLFNVSFTDHCRV